VLAGENVYLIDKRAFYQWVTSLLAERHKLVKDLVLFRYRWSERLHSTAIHLHRRQGCSQPDHPLRGLRRTASFLLGKRALSLRDLAERSTHQAGGQVARWDEQLTAVRDTVPYGLGAFGLSRTLGGSAYP